MNMGVPIYNKRVLVGVSAADATGIFNIPEEIADKALETTVYVEWDHTSAAGAVLLEAAPYYTYSGTWKTEGTVTWAASDSIGLVHLTATNSAMRVRVWSAVTSGTANVWVRCFGPS